MDNNEWKKIVHLYTYLKDMVIKAEELGGKRNTKIQPLLELRSAIDHFFRAKSAELDVTKKKNKEKYINYQYDKMVGHFYRGFFDAADWLSIVIRNKVEGLLDHFSYDCIRDNIPNYYTDLLGEFNKISQKVSEIRQDKDIGEDRNNLLNEVEEYKKIIDSLKINYDHIVDILPALARCEDNLKQQQKKEERNRNIGWLVALLISIICVIIGTIIGPYFS
jgi:hypothetical protein